MSQKFFTNMSTGAASLLKESMGYCAGHRRGTIEEDRTKIIELVKLLDMEGRISVLPKGEDSMD